MCRDHFCKDKEDNDIFASYRHQVGKTSEYQFAFYSTKVVMTGRSKMTYDRVSDEGCMAPTTVIPTTVAPTTEAPTTVAPTTEAPTTVVPTTQAPTTEAPTTVVPTTQAPTTEVPTVAPTTAAPTEAPTAAPTATPTEKPTEKPKSTTGWLVGGAIAILIGFGIIFYIVVKKNKHGDEEEMAPLV